MESHASVVVFLLVVVLCMVGISGASAAVFTIPPVADATIQQHAGVDTLVQTDDVFLQALGVGSFDWRAALEFPLDAIPTGSTITSAGLRLRVAMSMGDPGNIANFELHGYPGDGLITVGDAQNDTHFLHAFSDTIVSFTDRTIDVTTFIQERITSGGSYVGFLVKTVPGSMGGDGFASMEHENADWRPYLQVVTTAVAVDKSTWGRLKTLY